MPTKILKYKYGINLKDMYVNEIENNSESNGFTICESTWNNKESAVTTHKCSLHTHYFW